MTRTTLLLPFALFAVTSACVDDTELGSDRLEGIVFGGGGEECPKLGCGSNSAYLGPTEFHELHETGIEANAEGFRITSFEKNGQSYRLDVTGTTLTGQLFVWGQGWVTALSGSQLIGAEMKVDGPNGTRYGIRIYNTATVQQYWQGPAGAVQTYELKWRMEYPAATHYEPVCKDPPNRIDGEGKEWQRIYEAVLFTGDRYDTSTLRVTASHPRTAGGWFNIGCAGTVLAKLALNRHTSATAVPGALPPTGEQRQAMLKMYTSDVCDTGHAFTVQGTPIRWWSQPGWSSPAIGLNTPEAHWNQDGAMCLDVHRLNNTLDDMDAQIQAACVAAGKPLPPPCGAPPAGWYLRTASPALP